MSTTRLPGVVDTLTAGFDHVNRILWVIALPIVVDLFLWFVPRLSAGPFIHGIVGGIDAFYASVRGGLDPSSVEQARQALHALDGAANSFNAWTILLGGLAVVPSVSPHSRGGILPFQIASGGQFLATFLVLELLGTILGCAYLGLIAQEVRDGRTDVAQLIRRLPFFVATAFALVLLAIGLFLVVSVPIGLVLGLTRAILPALGDLLTIMVFIAAQSILVLGLIYLFFLLDAIVVSDAGPIRAVANSARVVSRNFWEAVRFIFVFVIIDWGLQLVWMAMSKNTVGTLAAIVGNAYVASGLAAASMQYYQSRLKV